VAAGLLFLYPNRLKYYQPALYCNTLASGMMNVITSFRERVVVKSAIILRLMVLQWEGFFIFGDSPAS